MFGLVSKKELDNLQKEYDALKLRLDKCREIEAESKILQDEILSLASEVRGLKTKLREQTEADLFFVSAKIQKKLLDGEPKENIQDLRLQQIGYQNQLTQLQQAAPYPNSFLGNFGLGGLFGNRY